MTPLTGWENFYVIVGSSAGALIGLQFVVMSLLAEAPIRKGDERAGEAFSTPNIIHFAAVLFLSAAVSAPWQGLAALAAIWALLGLGGIAYSIVVARRMRTQTVYRPVREDWLFHIIIPLTGYAILAIAWLLARASPTAAMFVVAGSSLVLLFAGIHNAWDMVTYQVFVRNREARRDESPPTDKQP